ncbi:MAG: type IX secretion system sortase PorU [Bacteroidales bacterium]|nr:type IX secretion system sortase PorU [Bacteroidales bacterium]
MKYLIILIFHLLIFLNSHIVTGQEFLVPITIQWNQPVEVRVSETNHYKYLSFIDAKYDHSEHLTPYFQKRIRLEGQPLAVEVGLINPVFVQLSNEELRWLSTIPLHQEEISVQADLAISRGETFAVVGFSPFRINPVSGKVEKLVSGELILKSNGFHETGMAKTSFVDQSVLANGNWFKIKIDKTGLFKVTYAQLAEMGMNVSGLSSSNIRVYGNGGGMLPEKNSTSRFVDLQETSIAVMDGGDGSFNQGDYLVFYGIGPDVWKFDPQTMRFFHEKHVYSDYSYYYVTADLGPGKRITPAQSTTETHNYISTTFNDYQFHELDQVNLIKSGREWYGEIFDLITSYNYAFNFPNLKTDAQQHFRFRAIAKSVLSSTFAATITGIEPLILTINGTPDNPEGQYARDGIGEMNFLAGSDNVNINIKYNKTAGSATGWLDYLELNVVRNSAFSGGQMAFRDLLSFGSNKVTEFRLNNANAGVTIWEITDPHNIKQVQAALSGNTMSFKLPTEELKEFIASDGTTLYDVQTVGKVPNQNLHGLSDIEYVIVSHPDFLEQANRLAEFHRSYSNLETIVVTPEQVYNEFSSGAQDITAIRDFMKLLYERGDSGIKPRYLLLFGDASYDFKVRLNDNTNYVPTFQSSNSLHYVNSYATDDYFGYLDPNEGTGANDMLDIGIGRFVVRTPDEAKMAVDKVIHYATSPSKFGNWRNVVTFVADDENQNAHLNQAEQLAVFVDTTYRNYNVDKIYIDSYLQESTTGGQRYPAVNKAINSRLDKGTLIMNYTGHGGELGWAHERILEVADINSWTNYDKLSIFITATCEFARYDDPGRISAGEYVFLNPIGGGIALFTTARLTFGSSNLSLNRGIYKYAFERNDGNPYALGDLIRLAKGESSGGPNDKKFLLIGDPALQMAYSYYNVETTAINQNETFESSAPDTLRALSLVTVAGRITDEFKSVVSDFNGVLHATVFDKESEVFTLGQDPGSSTRSFMLRRNTLFNGRTQVVDGNFSFSFMVPKDIAYEFGPGKISFFADNESVCASGFYQNIIIGGFDNTSQIDITGPDIDLFMNDETFRNGDVTNENPVLLARVYDDSGINAVGNSIGHDITAVLNGDAENPFILNDFYEADFGGFRYGTVLFPFTNLPSGTHELKFKIWDVFNNSSEAMLTFRVINQNELAIESLKNYPNPFHDETYFTFNHNKANSELDVSIEIYDLSGRQVAVIQQYKTSTAFSYDPLRWDGTNATGQLLESGMYLYRVHVTDQQGRSSSDVKKLIITR